MPKAKTKKKHLRRSKRSSALATSSATTAEKNKTAKTKTGKEPNPVIKDAQPVKPKKDKVPRKPVKPDPPIFIDGSGSSEDDQEFVQPIVTKETSKNKKSPAIREDTDSSEDDMVAERSQILPALGRMEERQSSVDQRLTTLQSELRSTRNPTSASTLREWRQEANKFHFNFNNGVRDRLASARASPSTVVKDDILDETLVIASTQPYPELRDLRDPELRSLRDLLPSIIVADRAPNTIKKYVRAFKKWKSFATAKDLPYLPATGPHLALYLLKLLQSSRSPAPLDSAAFAVAWAHRKAGYPSPHLHPLPAQILQAAKRLLAAPVSKKLPLTSRDIHNLCSTFLSPSIDLDNLQTLCLIVLGFSGFLRWDDLSQLHVDDVNFCNGYVALFLEKRKNDQFREGHWSCIARTDKPSCPASILQRFLKASGSTGHFKLFRRIANIRGSLSLRQEPMSYTRAREKVLTMLSAIGLDARKYGLHSLRSGGASTAAAMGVPDRLIAHHGGWRSTEAREGYILESKSSLLGVSRSLGL
ncbi:Hypp7251 [Branchiostoma lanceolatum]|uniref:Hypp7251 protein n=1 Tax=Branchiostoma lanceolatum TaxID=7740 RepID=A0A8K0ECN8_BRALA|nr:Hypp7251 [Branchiostoma lanceolatum]